MAVKDTLSLHGVLDSMSRARRRQRAPLRAKLKAMSPLRQTPLRRTAARLRAARQGAALSLLAAALAGCAALTNHRLLESPADAKISAAVRTLLRTSPALDAPNLVSVQTHDGVVYLSGLVSTPYQVGAAGSLAAQAPGAADVQNLLSIDNAR